LNVLIQKKKLTQKLNWVAAPIVEALLIEMKAVNQLLYYKCVKENMEESYHVNCNKKITIIVFYQT